ncbi:MAG: 3-deoxy-7-phosphoheptulonate synthase [Bacteroidota bacterium]
MIAKLKNNSADSVKALFKFLDDASLYFHYLENEQVVIIPKSNDISLIKDFEVVETIYPIDTPFQLASNIWKKTTTIDFSDFTIGANNFNIIAGPCSVENEEQIFKTAEFLSKIGVGLIRGGAFKPRTSPYSFRGLGVDGLKILKQAAKQYNLKIVTEILDLSMLDDVYQYADVLQVGSRNMQNFYMLNELGKIEKPVLLKRGMTARVYEWLLAAEYILSGGNEQVILCERGIRSFDPQSRNVFDLGAISLIKELSHLPIIADPSHGTGASSRVLPMSLAAAATGADGLIIEIHPEPSKALSDKEQALNFTEFEDLIVKLGNLIPNLPYNKTFTLPNKSILNFQSQ